MTQRTSNTGQGVWSQAPQREKGLPATLHRGRAIHTELGEGNGQGQQSRFIRGGRRRWVSTGVKTGVKQHGGAEKGISWEEIGGNRQKRKGQLINRGTSTEMEGANRSHRGGYQRSRGEKFSKGQNKSQFEMGVPRNDLGVVGIVSFTTSPLLRIRQDRKKNSRKRRKLYPNILEKVTSPLWLLKKGGGGPPRSSRPRYKQRRKTSMVRSSESVYRATYEKVIATYGCLSWVKQDSRCLVFLLF